MASVSRQQLHLPDLGSLKPGTICNGWYYVPAPADVARKRKSGELVYISRGTPIRLHHASSVADAMAAVGRYRELAKNIGSICLFRGQTRDYFTGRYLTVAPAALRPGATSPFARNTSSREVADELGPWLGFLRDYGIDLGTSLQYTAFEDTHDSGNLRLYDPGPLTGRRSSTGVVGILQHYGFPTYCLDVSADPQVSMWFALHRCEPDSTGTLRLTPLSARPRPSPGKARDLAAWPTLHIYMQPQDDPSLPVIDLRDDDQLGAHAKRPRAQEAYVLPFFSVGRAPGPRGLVDTYQRDATRRPTGVVKLYFGAEDLAHAAPALTRETVLPSDDRLYQQMVAAKLPRLAVYRA